jgi:hypothetical protein
MDGVLGRHCGALPARWAECASSKRAVLGASRIFALLLLLRFPFLPFRKHGATQLARSRPRKQGANL